MQAQSRLDLLSSADDHEAVVRELMRGHELTARLQEEALRALRGQGQAEATAAFILREVSRAFTVCLSIMAGSPAPAGSPRALVITTPRPPETPEPTAPGGAATLTRRNKEDTTPRRKIVTPTPNSDGYQWRKYGQKRINNTRFPRCYYRCCYYKERNCPATKQVQLQRDGDTKLYAVVYCHDHACHTPAASEPEPPTSSGADALDFPGTSTLRALAQADADDRGAKAERERQALVSSLTCVLQGGGGGSSARAAAAPAAAPSGSACTGELLPTLDADEAGLDVMDYDVAEALCFGSTNNLYYGERDDDMLF